VVRPLSRRFLREGVEEYVPVEFNRTWQAPQSDDVQNDSTSPTDAPSLDNVWPDWISRPYWL
jgi:hypothetical protein